VSKKIELEILGLTSSQSQSGSFALVLGEKKGTRRLPIIIGMFEAQAIAVEIERMTPVRPMTHDLFKDFIIQFGVELLEIRIDDLKEGIYYAKIVASNNERKVEFDARPSDAMALAVRFGIPIFTNEKIMNDSGINPSELDETDALSELERELESVMADNEDDLEDESIADITLEELHTMLDQALKGENYEEAARIRDEINKRS
jgi:uncharacterized protein